MYASYTYVSSCIYFLHGVAGVRLGSAGGRICAAHCHPGSQNRRQLRLLAPWNLHSTDQATYSLHSCAFA